MGIIECFYCKFIGYVINDIQCYAKIMHKTEIRDIICIGLVDL